MKMTLKTIFSAPSLTDILSPKPEIKGTDMILHEFIFEHCYVISFIAYNTWQLLDGYCL